MKKLNIQKVPFYFLILKSLKHDIYLFFLSLCLFFKEENEPVADENKDKNTNNKWKKYLDLIEKALADYNECESQNCSCYKKLPFFEFTSNFLRIFLKLFFLIILDKLNLI